MNFLTNFVTSLRIPKLRTKPSRERLRHLEADIRRLRERTDESSEADDPMLERFEDAIDHFETSHPQLTMMISQMMTILSNAGI